MKNCSAPVELHRELLIAFHRLINGFCEGLFFLFCELRNLLAHIVRQAFARESDEFCHDIRHAVYGIFLAHCDLSYPDILYTFPYRYLTIHKSSHSSCDFHHNLLLFVSS